MGAYLCIASNQRIFQSSEGRYGRIPLHSEQLVYILDFKEKIWEHTSAQRAISVYSRVQREDMGAYLCIVSNQCIFQSSERRYGSIPLHSEQLVYILEFGEKIWEHTSAQRATTFPRRSVNGSIYMFNVSIFFLIFCSNNRQIKSENLLFFRGRNSLFISTFL